MLNLTSSSGIYQRQQQEALAQALLEKQRRKTGTEPGKLDLLGWSCLHRPQLKEDAPFDLVKHFYLSDIYQVTAQIMVIYKASQMGASEWAVSYALHAADDRQANVLYVFPTDTHVSDFSSARIGPAIEVSPYLAQVVVDGGAAMGSDGKRKYGADRVKLKRVRNRFIYLRGAQVSPKGLAPQLKSIDADVLILDEVDEMDPRAPAIAIKRLGHSSIAEQRWISTPTYAGVGIHAEWLKSDQREWHVRCDRCGEWQPLTIRQVVTEWDSLDRPVAWNEQDGQPFIACRKCSAALDRLQHGQWVATYPGREIVGFHLTKLFSPLTHLGAIVQALNTTDETKRREAFNQDLGEPYTPRGGQLTDDVLDECRRDYAHVPAPFEETFAGVDVGRVLHVVIRGPRDPITGERPQRFAGEVDSFEALGNLLRHYKCKRTVIDALPETREARKLQAAFKRGEIYLAYYVGQETGSKNTEPEDWNGEKGVVNLDRTRALDQMYARFFERENTLPAYARDVPDYYAHMKAPVRILEESRTGEKVARYVESGPDHFAHAENYCAVASKGPAIRRAGVWGRKIG